MLLFLLIVFVILIICFGFYIMAKIDQFVVRAGNANEEYKSFPTAIVLGGTELANQVSLLLEKNKFHVMHLTEPYLMEREQNFVSLFALSENDADNIVLYKIGLKLYGIDQMISICNDSRNESIFTKEKISYLAGNEATAERIYETAFKNFKAYQK